METKPKKRPLPAWMNATSSNKIAKYEREKRNDNFKTSPRIEIPNGHQNKDDEKNKREQLDKVGGECSISETPMNPSDYITQSMPYLEFSGQIVYTYQLSDCNILCEEIVSTLQEKTVIGFDMEWPVSYQKGSANKTALIQMCFDSVCYLYHTAAMRDFPKMLKNLILDPRVLLVGLNIESDLWKLERDFCIGVKSAIDQHRVVDLSILANKKLKSSERWSLEGLCRNVLKRRLSKENSVRCGEWNKYPLTGTQKQYAVHDAYASLALYKRLSHM